MKHISFAMTIDAFVSGQKDVTRRSGWRTLEPGDRLMAVEKAMGLKKGEKMQKLGEIEVVDVRREPLDSITAEDVAREGYPDMSQAEFVAKFCKANKCFPDAAVTRIEFKRCVQWR